MATPSIHPDTKLGHVDLVVSDFKKSLPFYQNVLGMKVHRNEKGVAHLGAGGADLLRLTENPDARDPGHATGLYHFALLVPSRFELARSLRRMLETKPARQGFGDHLVSEALYLSDPDGNGIEVYRDRPRSEWQYDAQHHPQMATDPLDARGILKELDNETEPWQGLDPDTVLGHMHLKIANVKQDEAFYRDILGFDSMFTMPSAAFVSAGGYHHHLGMNTWESAGAPPPARDTTGLKSFTIELPNTDELTTVTNRVRQAGLGLEETDEGLRVRDPSHNAAILTVQNAIGKAKAKSENARREIGD